MLLKDTSNTVMYFVEYKDMRAPNLVSFYVFVKSSG